MFFHFKGGSWFWQYRLATFAPKGLDERDADVELDMFAYGMALILPVHLIVPRDDAGICFCLLWLVQDSVTAKERVRQCGHLGELQGCQGSLKGFSKNSTWVGLHHGKELVK